MRPLRAIPLPACVAAAILVLAATAPSWAASPEVLRGEDFHVHVRLFDGAEAARLRARVDCELIDGAGRHCLTLARGQLVRVEAAAQNRRARPMTAVVASFPSHRKSAARREADRWRRLVRRPVRVARLDRNGLDVCVGAYGANDDPSADLQRVTRHCRAARLVCAPPGTLRQDPLVVRDVAGRVVASAPGPLRVRPRAEDEDGAVWIGALAAGDTDWRRADAGRDGRFPGELILDADPKGRLLAVNRVHVEDYLRGVVPAEIGDAPYEALEAQAIASRSEALARVDSLFYRHPLYDLCSTQRTQVYRGLGVALPGADLAIEETAGVVLWHDGLVAEALFSANCGGVTANSEDVFDGAARPYLRGRIDAPEPIPVDLRSSSEVLNWMMSLPPVYSNAAEAPAGEYFRWRQRRTIDELTRSVNRWRRLGAVRDVRIVERSPSGRVKAVVIECEKGDWRLRGYSEIRRILSGVHSTFFVVTHERAADGGLRAIVLYGAGQGHGCGMCQTGAFRMAEKGYTSTQILRHYYANVELGRM